MGFFSAYIGGSKPSKHLVAGRVAALIKCVRRDIGDNALNAGRIVLCGDYTVEFRGMHTPEVMTFHASVSIKEVSDRLLKYDETYIHFMTMSNVYSEAIERMLVFSVINEFEKQSLHFTCLPSLLIEPVGRFVFLAKSSEFREASIQADSKGIAKLLKNDTWTHYLMETFENPGGAKVREMHEKAMKGYFVDGIIESYEEPI
jgi:hypothetical protein